jgi:selenocysteine-specific elongation factor
MAAQGTAGSGALDHRSIRRVVVGTAGHIDHGKSTLVARLTGIDPDRLPEEKARGLTIDLGFANLRMSDGTRIGLIDVPGHEKFVHNMVAGASGIDFALFVVAADDGVMPQTIEHLEILELLGIRRGAIVITKIDMAGPEMRELAVDDVRQAVRGTFLEKAPLFCVSSATGEGIDELRAGLETMARETPERSATGVFRMPVQRVFAAKGFGCVLTGIPVSGSLQIGDPVEVLPPGLEGTVRGLEAYHQTVERISAGHSSAMNISGIEASSCVRGMSVVSPGYFPPTRFVAVQLKHLARRRRPLRDRELLRLHVGTSDVGATLLLLDRSELLPGDTAFVQLHAEEPVVCGAGDRFLVRIPSPAQTAGGGVVVDVRDRRLRRRQSGVLAELADALAALGDVRALLLLEARRAGAVPWKLSDVARRIGAPETAVSAALEEWIRAREIVKLKNQSYLSRAARDGARAAAEKAIAAYFTANPQRLVCERLVVGEAAGLDPALLDEVLHDLVADGKVSLEPGGGIRTSAAQKELPADFQKLRNRALEALEAAAFQPPTVEELAAKLACARPQLDLVLKRLAEERKLARISPEYYFSMAAVEAARAAVVRNCESRRTGNAEGDLDLPALRDDLKTTRRWMIPLVEWFDATGFTTRLGARRILKKRGG